MSNGGWILLWKKVWDSDFLQGKNKPNRVLVWIWLLTHCNENGVVTFGRYKIAQDTGLSDSQVRRVLATFRDEAANQKLGSDSQLSNDVSYEAAKHFTTITLKNWAKYQRRTGLRSDQSSDEQPTNNRPTKRPHYKEIKELKTKEIILPGKVDDVATNSVISLFKSINPSYEQLFKRRYQRQAAGRLAKKFSLEQIERLVGAAGQANGQEYAPVITTPCQLEDKLPQLKSYWDRNEKKGVKLWKIR